MSVFSKVFHNGVIRSMVVIEFFGTAAYGVTAPVFAIFAADFIQGGSAQVAGFAIAIFWIVKAIVQLPVARYIDKHKGERDDFWVYFGGQLLWALTMFLYVFAKTPLHVYLIQALAGAALAISIPALYGIFSRHLDKNYESFEWSVYSVFSFSVATAIAGAVSGIIVTNFGFKTLFIVSALFFLLTSLLTFFLLWPKLVLKDGKKPVKFPGIHHRGHDR